jgi:precorrin-2 dehydrogenase/sirohydrochlorin ferrochelatase
VWCNVADDPEAGDFILPSVCRRGDLSVAVSTAGQSPAVARMVRKELDDFLGPEYAVLLRLLGRIRKDLLDCGLGCDHNQDVFRGLAASELKTQLACGDSEGAARTLRSHLPEVLHSQIGVYLDGITNPA